MKLTHITFTGIDEHTDLNRVLELSEKYPYVEWGVLFSYKWKDNGNRYPSPVMLNNLRDLKDKLNLSAHFCGEMARDIVTCETEKVYETMLNNFDLFSRCQLNVNAASMYSGLRSMRPFDRNLKEVIIQMSSGLSLESFLDYMKTPTPRVAYLIDGSGGRGIDCKIYVQDKPKLHIGYAGGMNPENVGEKLKALLEYPSYGEFWIDMESGVRDDADWFDLDKAEKVLEICDDLVKKHNKM